MMRASHVFAAAVLAFAGAAGACGVCVEDKVAAAYDHAVVAAAIDRGHVVVFAEVKGPGAAPALVSAARKAARALPGVDGASVRSADAPAAISFTLDPGRRSPKEALAEVERRAAVPGLRLAMLKVMR